MQRLTLHTAKEKFVVSVPSTWAELTLQQLIDIEFARQNKPDVLRIFGILAGIDVQLAGNITGSNIEADIFNALAFLNEPPDWEKLRHPEYLIIAGVPHKTPTKVGEYMFGQKVLIMQSVETPDTMLKNIPYIVAVMFQPLIDKRANKGIAVFDANRVEKITDDIKNCNALQAYGCAMFFFRKFQPIVRSGIKDLTLFRDSIGKTKKLSRGWLVQTD